MRKSILLKSIRTMWRHKRAYFACIIVLAIGMSVFVGMFSASQKFDEVSDSYFEEVNFSDVFATVLSMPAHVLLNIKKIDGIKDVEGKLVKSVKGILEDDRIINVKLVGTDLAKNYNMNKYSYSGTKINQQNDIWLGKVFYNLHNYKPGDTITLILNGVKQPFTICGIVESPEYLITIPDSGIMTMDDEKITIGYVQSDMLEDMTNLEGMITNLSFQLNDGVTFEDVEQPIKYELKQFGLTNLYSKKDQPSYSMLKSNVATLATIATMIPFLFLIISIVMLYIMLKRFVEQERSEIGTLKAFGYSNSEIMLGYYIYGVVTGLVGFILSILGGAFIGSSYYNMLIQVFNLPNIAFQMSFSICMQAFIIAIGVSIAAVVFGASSVTEIHPAQAMRAAAPSVKRGKFKFNSKIISYILNARGIMGLRGISRSKLRSLLTVLSIVMSFALTNVLFAFTLSYEKMMVSYNTVLETYDMKVVLENFTPLSYAIKDVKHYGGIPGAEGMLVVPVTITNKNKKKDLSLVGVSETAQMYNIVDKNYEPQKIPNKGITLNTRMAQQLNAKAGDIVKVESPYLREDMYMAISYIVDEPLGSGCYMELKALNKLFGNEIVGNSVLFKTDKENKQRLQTELIYAPNVLEVVDQERAGELLIAQSSSTIGLLYMLIIMSFFMCFGVIYNVSRISMAEKERELATMRIIGFTVNETSEVNSFEHWVLFVVGCSIGFLISLWIKDPFANAFSSDDFSLIIDLTLKSTLCAIVCCMAAVILSNVMAKRQISKYKLVEVLKERE